MPDVISFEAAIEATKGEDRALLIGNGFSAQYFTYASLLAESGLGEGTPLHNLFTALGTADFEAVVRALEDAVVVERAYGNHDHAEELSRNAQDVREALVRAVNATHPTHREHLAFEYESSAAFLRNFGKVFTLNYDLLLYWVNLEKRLLKDGFAKGERTVGGRFQSPFKEEAWCDIYNLHGGLHLFQNSTGEIMKALDTGNGVIATITDTIANKKLLPLYVAEGSSKAKMRKINSVAYLRHCYVKLRENTASIFVFGHSADDNDAHIYDAIFGSGTKHVHFGVYRAGEGNLKVLDGQMAKYQKIGGKSINYNFYDAESAHVWDAGVKR
jgi:Domain of unknown function (DUF4917)